MEGRGNELSLVWPGARVRERALPVLWWAGGAGGRRLPRSRSLLGHSAGPRPGEPGSRPRRPQARAHLEGRSERPHAQPATEAADRAASLRRRRPGRRSGFGGRDCRDCAPRNGHPANGPHRSAVRREGAAPGDHPLRPRAPDRREDRRRRAKRGSRGRRRGRAAPPGVGRRRAGGSPAAPRGPAASHAVGAGQGADPYRVRVRDRARPGKSAKEPRPGRELRSRAFHPRSRGRPRGAAEPRSASH